MPSSPPSRVCVATSGPGAIHLLNGLYDAKLDHVPVVAIVGQTNRSAMGGSYQQEVDLHTLFKDVASEFVETVMVPEQLPNVLDRALRTALARSAPTAVIVPRMCRTRVRAAVPCFQDGAVERRVRAFLRDPDEAALRRAADILNSGERVAVLAGQGARGARAELQDVAELLGARCGQGIARQGRAERLLAVCDRVDRIAGDTASYELMRDCDTLLTVARASHMRSSCPRFDAARPCRSTWIRR